MATYVILSQFYQEVFDQEEDLKTYSRTVKDRIHEKCEGVEWKQSFATTGSVDAIDIVEADDVREVQKAAFIIRAMGYAHTETLQASDWDSFVDGL